MCLGDHTTVEGESGSVFYGFLDRMILSLLMDSSHAQIKYFHYDEWMVGFFGKFRG